MAGKNDGRETTGQRRNLPRRETRSPDVDNVRNSPYYERSTAREKTCGAANERERERKRENADSFRVFFDSFVRSTRLFRFPGKLKHEFDDIGSYSIFHRGEYRKYGRSPRLAASPLFFIVSLPQLFFALSPPPLRGWKRVLCERSDLAILITGARISPVDVSCYSSPSP